jgi:hypothetical protein
VLIKGIKNYTVDFQHEDLVVRDCQQPVLHFTDGQTEAHGKEILIINAY